MFYWGESTMRTKNIGRRERMFKSFTQSKLIKIGFLAILLTTVIAATASAASLRINVEEQVKEVTAGEAAHFLVDITNEGEETADVELSLGETELSVSFSDLPGKEFSLEPNETKTAHVLASTRREHAEQTFSVPLYVNGRYRPLAVEVRRGIDALRLHRAYEEITVTQGSSQKIQFITENTGDQRIKNIVIDGEISTRLDPQYPKAFFLNAKEQRSTPITIEVPDDFPTGRYVYEVTAASGDVIGSRSEVILNVVESSPLKDRLRLRTISPWEPLTEDGEEVGYRVTFEIENKGLMDIQDVEWDIEGLPREWNISGDQDFDIQGGETARRTLEFHTGRDFSRQTLQIGLVKDGMEITREQIEFEGDRIGVRVGGLVIGALAPLPIGIGILIGFLIIVVIYLMDGELLGIDIGKERKDDDYLKRLVDETIEREIEKGNIERPDEDGKEN